MKKFLLDCQQTDNLYRKKGALASLHRRHPELDALSILGDSASAMSKTSYLYYFLKKHAVPCSLRGRISSSGTYKYHELQAISSSLLEKTYLADKNLWRGAEAVVYLESQQILNPASDKDFVQYLKTADRHEFVRACPDKGFPVGNTHQQCLFNFLISKVDARVATAAKELATTTQRLNSYNLLMEKLLD